MRVTSRFVVFALSLGLVGCTRLPIDQSPAPLRLEPQFSIPTAIPDTLLYLEFIVGPDGHPEAGTLRFVDARNRSIHYPQAPAFLDSVWAAVRQWEYTPAQFQGAPVRALVRQPVIHRRVPKADTVSMQSLDPDHSVAEARFLTIGMSHQQSPACCRPCRSCRRFAQGTNVLVLDPDVAAAFPDSAAVNEALRKVAGLPQPGSPS